MSGFWHPGLIAIKQKTIKDIVDMWADVSNWFNQLEVEMFNHHHRECTLKIRVDWAI